MSQDQILVALQAMQDDPGMITESAFTPNIERWPDNIIPFVDIHMNYLAKHRNVNPQQYLSNLRLMIRVRA